MIRFHALRFDSIRRFHHLFQDEKKAGISNGHFKQMNDYLVGSHVPRPGSHVPGPVSHFSCDPGPGSHVPGPGSQYRTRNGNGQLFSGSGTRYFAILSKKKFEYRGTCDPKKKYRVPGTGTKFRSCPSLIGG